MVGEVGPGGVRQPGTVIKLAEAVACGRVGNEELGHKMALGAV